jgi:hypothetical protein
MRPLIDPRDGDVEDDASSTKRRSLLSLAATCWPRSPPQACVVLGNAIRFSEPAGADATFGFRLGEFDLR